VPLLVEFSLRRPPRLPCFRVTSLRTAPALDDGGEGEERERGSLADFVRAADKLILIFMGSGPSWMSPSLSFSDHDTTAISRDYLLVRV
jgi:hypothetical protein